MTLESRLLALESLVRDIKSTLDKHLHKGRKKSDKTCIICGDSFSGHTAAKACNKASCRDAMLERQKLQVKAAAERFHSRLNDQEKEINKNKCIVCGRPCAKNNRFFCAIHGKQASNKEI